MILFFMHKINRYKIVDFIPELDITNINILSGWKI